MLRTLHGTQMGIFPKHLCTDSRFGQTDKYGWFNVHMGNSWKFCLSTTFHTRNMLIGPRPFQADRHSFPTQKPPCTEPSTVVQDLTRRTALAGRRWFTLLFAAEFTGASEPLLRYWDAFLAEEERFELPGYLRHGRKRGAKAARFRNAGRGGEIVSGTTPGRTVFGCVKKRGHAGFPWRAPGRWGAWQLVVWM